MFLSEALVTNKADYFLGPTTETEWVKMQPFLLRRGYRLRPRYDPAWIPSWFQVRTDNKYLHPIAFEDSLLSGHSLLDAVRVSDSQKVVLKRVKTDREEIGISTYLSSEENRRDRRNHAVPILDVIMIPGTDEEALLVMPFLQEFHHLPFRFLGEFCEFALQILEALEFMHEHNIAHRDTCWKNLMMDTTKMVPKGQHFSLWSSHDGIERFKFQWKTQWSVRPVPYYIIDFGLSTRCASKETLVVREFAQDKTVPELSKDIPYNPFMVDVYHFGNVLKTCMQDYQGLDAFNDLADAMTRPRAQDRPTISKSVEMCKEIIAQITMSRNLKTRIWRISRAFSTPLRGRDKLAVILGWNNPLR